MKWFGIWLCVPVLVVFFLYQRHQVVAANTALIAANNAELVAERAAKADREAAKQCSDATAKLHDVLAETQKALDESEQQAIKESASAHAMAKEIVKHIDDSKPCRQAIGELRDSYAGKKAPL